MKRWILLAAGCYPRRWREQYGDEFRALLDDVKPSWRVLGNVLGGAIHMQFWKGANGLKIAAAMAVAGVMVAAGVSLVVPRVFVSSAVLQVTPQADAVRPASPQEIQERAAARVAQIEEEVLSRSSLSSILLQPSLDLYRTERHRMPMEEIIQKMRRDIRITPMTPASSNEGIAPMTFRISFAYPDAEKARAVVRALITKFTEQNVMVMRNQRAIWDRFWQDQAAQRRIPIVPPPSGQNLRVVERATFPGKPVAPNRVAFLAWGLGLGLLSGLFVSLARQRRHGFRQLAGFALAGCLIAGTASLLIPDRYTSTAVLRITPAILAEDPMATPTATPATEALHALTPDVLSRSNLAGMIQDPRLNLYPRERAKQPLEAVIEQMRNHDIHIASLETPGAMHAEPMAFSISFSYPDPFKAQAVVRELVTGFVQRNIILKRASVPNLSAIQVAIEEHKAGENLEVLDPASLPQAPISPDRAVIAAAGLGLGLLAGAVTLWLRRPASPDLQPA